MIVTMRNGRHQGLSLIEVIVALVVISASVRRCSCGPGRRCRSPRARPGQQQAELERNITELALSLNPAERPTGELLTATHRYQWRANPMRGPVDQVRQPAPAPSADCASWSELGP